MTYKKKFTYSILISSCALFLSITYFYILAASTGLQGRRGGPQDAFRHIYASAFITRYLSPKIVKLVTILLEGNGTTSPHNKMDRHNNALGIQIGLSKSELYLKTFSAVQAATLSENANKTTAIILEKKNWSSGF